jgi:ATP synthase protein I
MGSETSPNRSGKNRQGGGDPWAAFGYLVAGVGFYGFLGWALGRWLGASYLTPLGIVLGAVFGIYLVFHRYAGVPAPPDTATDHTTSSSDTDDTGTAGTDDR